MAVTQDEIESKRFTKRASNGSGTRVSLAPALWTGFKVMIPFSGSQEARFWEVNHYEAES
jgi:hypothetical protein